MDQNGRGVSLHGLIVPGTRPRPLAGRASAPVPDPWVTLSVRDVPPRPRASAPATAITVLVASRTHDFSWAAPAGADATSDIRYLAPRIGEPCLLMPALQQHPPDVLLLDQDFYDRLDADTRLWLRMRPVGLHILLLARAMASDVFDTVLLHRFHGALPANAPPDECLKAVRAVCRGEIWLPRALLGKAVVRLMSIHSDSEVPMPAPPVRAAHAPDVLSRREREIVEFLRQGLTNKEIARRLDIMEDTVKKHLQNVFGKLGVRRRSLVALDLTARSLDAA